MNVFLKYILKSTFSKKGRSLLLIITITISAALLIGSMGAVDAGNTANEEHANRLWGDYDVLITANKTSEVPFFNKNKISKSNFESFVASTNVSGYLYTDENVIVEIKGVASKDYTKLPNMKLLEGERLSSLTGDKVIISEKASKTYNYKLGDTIKVKVRGESKSFKVSAIAETKGEFLADVKNHFSVVADEKTVCKVWDIDGLSNSMLVKLKSDVDRTEYIKDFNRKNSDCSAAVTFDKEKAKADAASVETLFYFMLLIVVLMSSFIIYSCFKLIVLERLPVVGTFLSQGETRGGIIRLLLAESIMYGVVGGILSVFLGAGLLYLLADLINEYKEYGVATKVDYNISYFIAGIIFAIVIPLISALLPVLATRKLEIKDIILNKINVSYRKSYKLSIFGIILALVVIAINFGTGSMAVSLSPIIFFLFLIGAVISLPGVTSIISHPLMKMFENVHILFKLSLNNIKTSKVLLNNIRLIVIGTISIILIMSLSSSFSKALLGMAGDYNYNICVYQGEDPARIKYIVYRNTNVKKVIETYFIPEGEIKGSDMKIAIGGINPDTFKDFNNYFGIENKDEFYGALNKSGRNMVINDKAAKVLGKSKGDYVVLKINNKEAEYKIVDIFNAKFAPDQILINKDNMIRDFRVAVPDSYNLQINGDVNEVKSALEKELKGTSARVTTFDEEVKTAAESTELLINILLFFSLMTVVMGVFGIVNNIGVSLVQRKKDLAVLSSVGMTGAGNGTMILLEGILTAVIAAGFGGLISYFAVAISNNLAKFIELSFPIEYDFNAFFVISIGILIIMMLSSSLGVFKSSKISIVNELKYE